MLKRLCVLTRTHRRKKEFEKCRESVLKLKKYFDIYHVVGIDFPCDYAEGDIIVPCSPQKIPIPINYMGAKKAPYNTYLHQLIEAAEPGWAFFIDDDDEIIPENFAKLAPLMQEPRLIIARFDAGGKKLPERFPAKHDVPICSAVFPVSAAAGIKAPGVYGGDALFISEISKRLKVEQVDIVIAKSQDGFGGGTGDPYYSIIIPQFNNTFLTRRLLNSLALLMNINDVEVIVVDNNSTEDFSFPLTYGFELRLVRREENDSVYASWNEGARAAKGEWLIFLNNDVVIKNQANLLSGLCLIRDALLSAGYYEKGKKWTSSGIYEAKAPGVRPHGFAGFAFALHRDLYKELGEFNTKFKLWYGDNEYFERARKLGKKCLIVGDVVVHHDLNATLKKIKNVEEIIEKDRQLWKEYKKGGSV